jgi:hypothetical protein
VDSKNKFAPRAFPSRFAAKNFMQKGIAPVDLDHHHPEKNIEECKCSCAAS